MYKDKKILGVITARGGSKAILRKNIKLLVGKPLIVYTIQAAQGSKYLTRCIVSTEDEEIAKISRYYGGDVPFLRPAEFAQDDSKSIDVVKDVLRKLEVDYGEMYDYVMILQPTSPLRNSADIDESIKKAVDNIADSVMSMVELPDFSARKLKKIENDKIVPWMEEEGKESNQRQNLIKVYKRNCAIYLSKVDYLKNDDLFGLFSLAHVMPWERSIDINEPIDFAIAEFFLQKKDDYL